MVVEGTSNERMYKTLIDVGPAVLNGGLSTFFAIILLCGSKSHAFITLFKVKLCSLFSPCSMGI